MRRLLRHIAPSVLLAASVFLAACGDSSCYDNGSSLPLASLYMGKSQQVIPQLTVKGIGVPGDSLLADATTVSEIYLPLQASVTTTSFAVSHPVSDEIVVRDTITFHYQPIAYFHSKECGAMYNFDIQRIDCTHHGIDSVVVVKSLITNSTVPSLRIYFTEFDLL